MTDTLPDVETPDAKDFDDVEEFYMRAFYGALDALNQCEPGTDGHYFATSEVIRTGHLAYRAFMTVLEPPCIKPAADGGAS